MWITYRLTGGHTVYGAGYVRMLYNERILQMRRLMTKLMMNKYVDIILGTLPLILVAMVLFALLAYIYNNTIGVLL
jgi:hypothetical protein